MKKILYTALLIILSATVTWSQQINVETTGPNDVGPCQEATFEITISNISSTPITSGSLTYILQAPIKFVSIDGLILSSQTNPQRPVFEFPGLPGNGEIVFQITIEPACNTPTGLSIDSVLINANGLLLQKPAHQYNIRPPVLQLTPGANWNYSGLPGETFTRSFTITNYGLGAATFIKIVDSYSMIGLTYNTSTPAEMNGNEMILTGASLGSDGALDYNESVTITQSFTIGDCSGGTKTLTYGWGCSSTSICNVDGLAYTISNANTENGLTLISGPISQLQPCQGSLHTISITNSGMEPAFDLEVDLGWNESQSETSNFDKSLCLPLTNCMVGSFILDDVSLSADMPYSLLFSQLAFDPDGSGGLDDIDGDGVYDDLAPGQSTSLKFEIAFDPSCLNCNSISSNYLHASVIYERPCGGNQTERLSPINAGVQLLGYMEDFEVPEVMISGNEYQVCIKINGQINGLTGCSNDSVIVEVSLPYGVVLPASFQPTFNNQPANYWQAGGNKIQIFVPSINGEVCMNFLAECNLSQGGGACSQPAQPGRVNFDGRLLWACGGGCGNANALDCFESSLFIVDCPPVSIEPGVFQGIVAVSATMKRLTMGFTDNLLTTRVNPTTPGLNLGLAIPYDSVAFIAEYGVFGLSGDVFLEPVAEITYLSSTGYAYFSFIKAWIEVSDQETGLNTTCEVDNVISSINNGFHTWSLSFAELITNGCFTGIQFTPGDVIRLRVVGVVNDNLPADEFVDVEALRTSISYKMPGSMLINRCGYQSTTFSLADPDPNWSSEVSNPNKFCDNTTIRFDLLQSTSPVFNHDLFPHEIRPTLIHNEIKINLPANYWFESGSLTWSWFDGDGASGSVVQQVNLPDPVISADGRMILISFSPNEQPVTDIPSYCSISLQVRDSCPIAPGNMVISFDRIEYFTEKDEIKHSTINQPMPYFNQALNSYNPVSGGALGVWNVRIRNNGLGNYPILFIRTSTNSVLQSIHNTYNNLPINFELLSEGFYQINLPFIASNNQMEVEITADYISCQPDTIMVFVAGSCSEQVSCAITDSLPLFFYPNVGFLQPSVTVQPAEIATLCEPLTYKLKIESIDFGDVFSPKVGIQLPAIGMSIIPGSCRVTYEGVESLLADPVYDNGQWVWTIDIESAPFDGPLKFQDEFYIQYDLKTDCQYIDRSRTYYSVSWLDVCGEESEGAKFIMPLFNIDGAPTAYNEYEIAMQAPEPSSACQLTPVRFSIIKEGLGATHSGEAIRVILPSPWKMGIDTINWVINQSSDPIQIQTYDSLQVIIVPLKTGVISGDSIVFDLFLHAPITTCRLEGIIRVQTTEIQAVQCAGQSCSFAFVNDEKFFLLVREKNVLSAQLDQTFSQIEQGADNEKWNSVIRFNNESVFNFEGDIFLTAFSDKNANSIIDQTDNLLGAQLSNIHDLASAMAQIDTVSWVISDSLTCNQLIVLITSSCVCDSLLLFLSPPKIPVSINDTFSACYQQPLVIQISGGNAWQYNWLPGNQTGAMFIYQYQEEVVEGGHVIDQVLLQTTRQNGCSQADTFYVITRRPEINLHSYPVLCHGDSTGSLEAFFEGTFGEITYQWSNPNLMSTHLPAGLYSLTISDEVGCSASDTAIVEQPDAIQITFTPSNYNGFNIDCNSNLTGAISTAVSGGISPYDFEWSSGENSVNVSGLSAGIYILTVTDSNQCTLIQSQTLMEPEPIDLSIEVAHPTCEDGINGRITVSPTGGNPPYSINNQSFSSEPRFDFLLSEGSYHYSVSDTNGCRVDTIIQLVNQISNVEIIVDSIKCHGGTGTISVISNGFSPFEYRWKDLSTTDSTVTGPCRHYKVTVTDNNNCRYIINHYLDQPDPLQLNIEVTSVSCYGLNDGQVLISVSGGTPNYTIKSDTTIHNTLITNLNAGNYLYEITDANQCITTEEVNIMQPAPLSVENLTLINVDCPGDSTGSASIVMQGGNPPYQYSWNNNSSEPQISNVTANQYAVTVVDSKGCIDTFFCIISEPQAPPLQINILRKPCYDHRNGSILVENAPLNSLWNVDDAPLHDITLIPNLGSGDHTLWVEDSMGCLYAFPFTMDSYPQFLAKAESDTTIEFGGEAQLYAVDQLGAGHLTYSWSGRGITCDTCGVIFVQPTHHEIYLMTAMNEYGCSSTDPVNVMVSDMSIYVPNAFRPGLDNNLIENNYFRYYLSNYEHINAIEFSVYDRWGDLCYLYNQHPENILGWDGTLNGKPMQPNVYVWKLKITFSTGVSSFLHGDVTLLR